MSRVFTSITISMALAVSAPALAQGVGRGYDVPLNRVLNLANGDHLLYSEFDPPHNLVRVNSSGDVLWARTIGDYGLGLGYVRNIVETGSGTLLMGMSSSSGPIIVCLDALGAVLWAEVVDAAVGPIGYPVVTRTTAGANILHMRGFGLDTADVVIKFDDDGAVLWAKHPIVPGTAPTRWVMPMTPDGLLLMSKSDCTPAIARMDNSGNAEWYWTIDPGQGCWQVEHVVQLPDSGLMAVYARTTAAGGPDDMVVSRLDPAGQPLWHRSYDPLPDFNILPGIDGMVAMYDGAVVQPGDDLDIQFIRIDTAGNTNWTASFPTNALAGTIAPATGDSIWSIIFQTLQPLCLWNRIATDEPPSGCMNSYVIPEVQNFTTQFPGSFSVVDVTVTTTPYAIDSQPITVTATQVCGGQAIAQQDAPAFTVRYDPGSDRVIVQLPHMVLGMVTIELFDIRGNTVRRSSAAAADGTAQLNTQGLAAAPYLVRVDHGSMRSTGKVFITR
ncbi:MAG: hypothetical protein KA352_04470 [Flavobacteriales bacterium]|nr:hypothetical protein [Flavobacteriales bacterium]